MSLLDWHMAKHGVSFTDTITFIAKNLVPHKKRATYASFIFNLKPLTEDLYRCRIVVGGDILTYFDDASSPAASLLETKLLINSNISTQDAKFMTADIKDFFLASPMADPEFMSILLKPIPEDIIQQYNLMDLVDENGYVYIRINKGMYSLK